MHIFNHRFLAERATMTLEKISSMSWNTFSQVVYHLTNRLRSRVLPLRIAKEANPS